MAKITANTKEVEVLVEAFAHRNISAFTFPLKGGKVSIQSINIDGEAEFKGLTVGYSVKLSEDEGMNAMVTLK